MLQRRYDGDIDRVAGLVLIELNALVRNRRMSHQSNVAAPLSSVQQKVKSEALFRPEAIHRNYFGAPMACELRKPIFIFQF